MTNKEELKLEILEEMLKEANQNYQKWASDNIDDFDEFIQYQRYFYLELTDYLKK